jgi:hypothetical protein
MNVQFYRLLPALAIVIAFLAASRSVSAQTETLVEAAEKGSATAQYLMGRMYEEGIETTRDFSKAATWYQKSASQGHAPAQSAFGFLLQTGEGVERNLSTAAEYFKNAAGSGDIAGQFYLAVAYINGIGLPKDAALAGQWFFKAASAGHQQSQLTFATMLQAGLGMKRNEFAARRWFDKAASGPNAEIAQKARSVRDQLDDALLFSGAFRPEVVSALTLVGLGLVAIYVATGGPPDHGDAPRFDLGSISDQERAWRGLGPFDYAPYKFCQVDAFGKCLY